MSKVLKNVVFESMPPPPVEPAIFIDEKSDSLTESIEKLFRMYEFRDKDAVVEYLQEYPFLLDLLLEAREKIDLYFGMVNVPILEVFVEHDNPAEKRLFAIIPTSASAEEAGSRLDRFDKEWWLHALERANCAMSIDLEFM